MARRQRLTGYIIDVLVRGTYLYLKGLTTVGKLFAVSGLTAVFGLLWLYYDRMQPGGDALQLRIWIALGVAAVWSVGCWFLFRKPFKLPYGYRYKRWKTLVVRREAEAIRLMFDAWLASGDLGEVVAALKAAGYRRVRGQPFTRGRVRRLLREEAYVGERSKKPRGFPRLPALIERSVWSEASDMLRAKGKG